MKRFCLQVAAFGSLQLLLFTALVQHHDVADETNYLAETAEKHRRLAQIPSPKIIVTGGSNVPFGLQSDRLEKALKIPVVNMGLAAGVGLDFMLRELEGGLRAGDWVVLSLEYDRFGGGFDSAILQQILQYRPAHVFALEMKHVRTVLLDRGLNILGAIVRSSFHSLTTRPGTTDGVTASARRGFNPWGDLTVHYGHPPRITADQANRGKLLPDRRSYPSAGVLARLNEFARQCHARGVRFAFSFPPHSPGPLAENAAAVSQIESALKQIPHLTILDSPLDQTYAPELFYDTGYHLGEAGARQRSEKLAASLQRAFLAQPR